MIAEETVLKWMRQRPADSHSGNAARMAREFLDEHLICDILSPDYSLAINACFTFATAIAPTGLVL